MQHIVYVLKYVWMAVPKGIETRCSVAVKASNDSMRNNEVKAGSGHATMHSVYPKDI